MLLLVVLFSSHLLPIIADNYPFDDPTLPWKTRTDDLVSRLSLEEIAAFSIAQYVNPPASVKRLNIRPYQFINECLRGIRFLNSTAFPQSLGISATFR